MLISSRHGDRIWVSLSGEIDHCSADVLRREIESLIASTDAHHLHLDFSKVSFMDSSGVGMIIGRYKTMMARGGSISAGGLSESVDRLYHLAGLHRIIPIIANGGQHGEQ